MRLWTEGDVLKLWRHAQRGEDIDDLMADLIAREIVHPIVIPEEMLTTLDPDFVTFLRTGELSEERTGEIEDQAIKDALRDYRGGQ